MPLAVPAERASCCWSSAAIFRRVRRARYRARALEPELRNNRTRFARFAGLGCAPRICEGVRMAGDPTSGIFIGSAAGGGNPQQLELKRANRHGLIAGRHRHRQDRHPAGHRRRAFGRRRPDLRRRREGRPVGPRDGRLADRQDPRHLRPAAPPRSAYADWHVPRLPGPVLGPVRRAGPSGPHHGHAKWGRCCSSA